MEEIFCAKIDNLDLPYEHGFTNQEVWIKIINNGKFLIANDKNFIDVIEQFEVTDKDVKIGITECVVKKKYNLNYKFPIIKIEKNKNSLILKLYKNGHPDSPITIKTSTNNGLVKVGLPG